MAGGRADAEEARGVRREHLTPEELDELGVECDTKLDAALELLLDVLGDGAWKLSAAIRAEARARGIGRRALYWAANLVVTFAWTRTFPARTLWRLSDEALGWLEEREAEHEPEPDGDAVSRFVRLVDAKLEEKPEA